MRSVLLRFTLNILGGVAVLIGIVSALFSRPIIELFNLAQVNVILLGVSGATVALLGVGTLLAGRNPIRHLLWLRLLIIFLLAMAGYTGLVHWGGGISRETAIILGAMALIPALLLLILFPRQPRLVSTRVHSPDGVLFTEPDTGGLFVRNLAGGFNPYVIRLSREPLMRSVQRRASTTLGENPSRVMVVGNGAREHTIAAMLKQSPGLETLYVAPGNGGTAAIAENLPISASDVHGIVRMALERGVELVIIGPEDSLARGLGDAVREAGILCLGPTRAAAQLEWSKVFAKEVMEHAGVPTAAWAHFSDYSHAAEYVRAHPLPLVIKADGLAAGKGVAVCDTDQEALAFLHHVMRLHDFGEAGDSVIIEEGLSGPELSVFALCDGEQMLFMPPASDYKRIQDGDVGPNTGGMGSYSPPEFVTDSLMADIRDTIFRPVLKRMVEIGAPYSGILYAGLMLTDDGPKVIEFNARMGDPEAQVVLPRLTTDFLQLATATAVGKLDGVSLTWTERPSVGIVLASSGYPGDYPVGLEISGLGRIDYDAFAFHAGTQLEPGTGRLHTSGGRVMTITALGDTLAEAREKAYVNVKRVSFAGAHYRHDIALRGISAQ